MNCLVGKKITSIEGIENDYIYINTDDGKCYCIYHSQDCCESVRVYDTLGDVNNILGEEIIKAEEYTEGAQEDVSYNPYDSYTWTFISL